MDWQLRPWQRRFLAQATAPGIRTAVLSLPRGNGKSSLAALLCERILDPADPWFQPGTESHLGAASIDQSRRMTFKLLRERVEGRPDTNDYRIRETVNGAGVTHKPTNTRLSVIASSGKRAQGLVRAPWCVMDEPGAREISRGELMYDSVITAQGKPGCSLRALFLGTLAPAPRGGW